LVPADEDGPAVPKPGSRLVALEVAAVERVGLSGTRGIETELLRRRLHDGECPRTVRRKVHSPPFAEAHDRRAVGLSKTGRVIGPSGLALVREEHPSAVSRQDRKERAVEPGEIPIFFLAGGPDQNTQAAIV